MTSWLLSLSVFLNELPMPPSKVFEDVLADMLSEILSMSERRKMKRMNESGVCNIRQPSLLSNVQNNNLNIT